MSNIVLLTRLQITEMLGGLRASLEKRTGANGTLAATAILALLALGGLGYLGYIGYAFLGSPEKSKGIFDILFLGVGSLTFIFSLPMVLSSFFASSDINDLLPLPVSPLSVVFSKALGALTSSYLWTLVLIAGPMAGWGIASGAGLHYWIAYLFAVIFAPLMPTAYSGILSIVIASLFKRVRRKDAITTITTVLTLAFAILLNVAFTSVSKSDSSAATIVNSMAESMGGIVMAFPAYGFIIYAFEHVDPLGIALFAGISCATFALFVLVARVLYLRIVTSLSSTGGKTTAYNASEVTSSSSTLKSLLSCEVKKIMRNSSIMLNYVVYPAVITPVIFVVLSSSGGIGAFFSNNTVDMDLIAPLTMSILMLFTVVATTGNKLSITGISRDGSNWIHAKFLPIPTSTLILSKTLPAFALNAFITLFLFLYPGIQMLGAGLSIIILVSAIVTMLSYSWLSSCMGIHYDCSNPRVDWGNDGDVNIKVLGGGAGTFRCFLVGLPFFVSPLVSLFIKVPATTFMPIFAVVSVVLALALGNVLLKRAAHLLETWE
ncbi:MAG: hypothetical protein Q4B54_01845 [Coriobacteriales bacterium]|nr:hypothetical protein [Coriobacteriales bacterium]